MKKNDVATSSDFNLQKLDTKQLSDHVFATITMGGKIAIFGRRGSGKTEIAKQQIKKAGLNEVYINLAVMERPDLGGYPKIITDDTAKYVKFLMPSFYEPLLSGEKKSVIIFDEVDKADQSLWQPLLEFVQYYSINNTKFTNLQAIILTGNLISEGGNRPCSPLLDRCEKYLVEPSTSIWLDWAAANNIHPSIIAYIMDNPKDLFGEIDLGENLADQSPRSWAMGSNIIYESEKYDWDKNLLKQKISGCIGKKVGIKYANYFDYYKSLLPMIDEIYKGKDVSSQYSKLEPTKKLVACTIASARLANMLDSLSGEELAAAINNAGNFFTHVDDEYVLVSIRTQITHHRVHKFIEYPVWEKIVSSLVNQM